MNDKKLKFDPCVGCGHCCLTAQCAVSLRVHGQQDICPSLSWNEKEKRHECELVFLPGILGEEFKKELYIGQGCCSSLNSWRKEPNRNRIIEKIKEIEINKVEVPLVFQEWCNIMGKQFMSGDLIALMLINFKNVMIKKHNWSEEYTNAYAEKLSNYIHQQRSTFAEQFLG